MAETSIPVDLTNPGQVFACLGFLEAADILLGEARGGFDWRDTADTWFQLAARGDEDPVAHVLHFLDTAEVRSVAPRRSANRTEQWKEKRTGKVKVETVNTHSNEFPFPDPEKPAKLPALLKDDAGRCLTIDHWGDGTRRDAVKFWAGSSGYPGAVLTHDALDLIRGRVKNCAHAPFSLAAEQSSSFRFDWRRDYIALDAGFSPKVHKKNMIMQGYPVVELMAAVGLSHARPFRQDRLKYNYGVAGVIDDDLYDPIFLRAALGSRQALFPGLPFRLFTMQLGWPGKEHQARCIKHVTEETL